MSMRAISLEECENQFRTAFNAAVQADNDEAMITAQIELCKNMAESLMAEYESMNASERNDAAVLASRGVRALTSAETKYYNSLIGAMRSNRGNVQAALTNLDVTMPETIIDQVMQDVESNFPVLAAVDFVNATYLTKFIFNNQSVQTASWGALGSAITKELNGAFTSVSATQCKLSAYMVVSNDYLDLGPAWLDRYIRAVLVEASGYAMEAAIVDGAGNADGAACPIGMTRDLDKGTVTAGLTTYDRKDEVVITDLDPATFGVILSALSKTATGRERPVSEVILVCNPTDYFTKVMPATTLLTPNGGYARDVLPFPTRVLQSAAVPDGHAVVGIAKNYIALLGAGAKQGVITYDDSVQFLEDNRVYKSRLLGNGLPKDNTSFVYLNIEGLEPMAYKTK